MRIITLNLHQLHRVVIQRLQETAPIDNFYLDMNGIIHMATHNNADAFIAANEEEMFRRIFLYTDRLYKLVAPTRIMFLAVDGVAPRAKMNQQRSRRFRSGACDIYIVCVHTCMIRYTQ